jgi:hypothetical protein
MANPTPPPRRAMRSMPRPNPLSTLGRARQLHRRGVRFNNASRFEAAEKILVRALVLFEATRGRWDEETIDAVNALAVCRFNAERFVEAVRTYRDLHARVDCAYGTGDPLSVIVAQQIHACMEAIQNDSPVALH